MENREIYSTEMYLGVGRDWLKRNCSEPECQPVSTSFCWRWPADSGKCGFVATEAKLDIPIWLVYTYWVFEVWGAVQGEECLYQGFFGHRRLRCYSSDDHRPWLSPAWVGFLE